MRRIFYRLWSVRRSWHGAAPNGILPIATFTVVSPGNGAEIAVRSANTIYREIAFSQIMAKTAKGEIVSSGNLRQLADGTVAIDLNSLAPGRYTIQCQVLSVDSHFTESIVRFVLDPSGK